MARQRRKRCIPKISKKGHVDKSKARQAQRTPHTNKYKGRDDGA